MNMKDRHYTEVQKVLFISLEYELILIFVGIYFIPSCHSKIVGRHFWKKIFFFLINSDYTRNADSN